MPHIRSNERSEAIELISHINLFLENKTWHIRSAGGEVTVTGEAEHMFPDVILYGDTARTQILQGWELKMPDVSIDDEVFVQDAQRKARTLGLNSCFIWNFTAGVLYQRNEDDTFIEIKRWNTTYYIRSRADVPAHREDWHRAIEQILAEINTYFATGQFRAASLGDVISDTVFWMIISRNKAPLAEELRRGGQRDVRMNVQLQSWWSQVRSEYFLDETDACSAYARNIIVNWVNRILFAHIIKPYHDPARRITELDRTSTPQQANALFAAVSAACDYYNIFAPVEYNEILPPCLWNDLMELNRLLSSNDFCALEQTALQKVLENTNTSGKRALTGQFTTPPILADMLVRITVRDLTAPCLDPCCGTGTIAQAMMTHKIQSGISILETYRTTWAADKFSFPLQLASLALARMDAVNQPLQVFQQNVFSLDIGEAVPLVDPADGHEMICHLPVFSAIVSNLPFVPFETIGEDEKAHILTLRDETAARTGIELEARSDLYQYLIFALHRMLAANGRLGVITSNSWLGTKAGQVFFALLGWYYTIDQVHISGQGRWFQNADVVTVLLILTKKAMLTAPSGDEETRFYVWQKALQEMPPDERSALAEDAILGRCRDPRLLQMSVYKKRDIDALCGMNVSLNALFYRTDWLLTLADKLCPLTDYFHVGRGERRGWDEMFYPAREHGIEPRYIRKVLKSSKQLTSLHAIADSDAFCCSASVEELEQLHHRGALAWIQAFRNQRNGKGKPLPQVLARKDQYWYEMRDTSMAEFVTGMNPDKRLFVAKFDQPAFVNQRLISLTRRSRQVDADLLHALLNSVLTMFYIEAIGFGRGLGALDINATNIKGIRILDPALLSPAQKEAVLTAFAPLRQRDVFNTPTELAQPDRIRFDRTVLAAYGIEPYYGRIKETLLSMQQSRHSARQRG